MPAWQDSGITAISQGATSALPQPKQRACFVSRLQVHKLLAAKVLLIEVAGHSFILTSIIRAPNEPQARDELKNIVGTASLSAELACKCFVVQLC